eukprot:11127526-Alexandrium_andersonii.AAC.1
MHPETARIASAAVWRGGCSPRCYDLGGPEVAVRSGSVPFAGRESRIAICLALTNGVPCGQAVLQRIGGGALDMGASRHCMPLLLRH